LNSYLEVEDYNELSEDHQNRPLLSTYAPEISDNSHSPAHHWSSSEHPYNKPLFITEPPKIPDDIDAPIDFGEAPEELPSKPQPQPPSKPEHNELPVSATGSLTELPTEMLTELPTEPATQTATEVSDEGPTTTYGPEASTDFSEATEELSAEEQTSTVSVAGPVTTTLIDVDDLEHPVDFGEDTP